MHKLNELFSVYINMSARTAPRTQTKRCVIQNMHKVNNLLIWAYKQNVIDEMREKIVVQIITIIIMSNFDKCNLIFEIANIFQCIKMQMKFLN